MNKVVNWQSINPQQKNKAGYDAESISLGDED